MRSLHHFGAAMLAATACLAAQAAGTVQVSFVQPEKFADVRDSAMRAEDNLALLKRHLQEAAALYVADGQTLNIEVLDVDLAGEVRHGARPFDLRVLRGRADWPRIELRYSLQVPGQAARAGQARLQDTAYLQRLAGLRNEALYYERRMLDEWFKAEFGAASQ
jgi:hypothetical protein